MKKRIFGTLLISTVLLGTLAACGGGGSSSKKNSDYDLSAIVVKHSLTKKNKDISWLQDLEKELGIKIKWEEVSADWDQKKAPMLASGDIPDLIIGNNSVTDSEFTKFPGLFEDLSDDLEELPNVQKMFDEKPETKSLATQPDGKMLGVPSFWGYAEQTATTQFINKEWLANVGMSEPTTWDELYDVLVAFKEKDANGNGDPNDEIPMDWAPVGTGGFGYFSPIHLLAGTGMTLSEGGNQGYFAENGEVKSFFTDERYKDTVTFFRKCWEAGLVNPKAFSQDYSAYQSTGRGDGELAKVGFSWGWESSDRFGATLASQYTPMAPLKQNSSSTPSWDVDPSLQYHVNTIQMSAKSKNKEKALAFINAMYSQEQGVLTMFGSLGEEVEKDGDTLKVLPPKDEKIDSSTWKWTNTWSEAGPMFVTTDTKVDLPLDAKVAKEEKAVYNPILDGLQRDQSVVPMGLMKFSNEDSTTLANNHTTILNEAMTKFAKWITKGGIDKEWDKYVETLEKGGLNDNVKIIQKGFDEFYAE